MTYKTHLSLSFASSFSLVFLPEKINPFFHIQSVTVFAAICVLIFISSLAPDFDEPESYLSKRFPWFIISHILSAFTTHRGVTHYAIASVIYTFIIFVIALLFLKSDIYQYLYILPIILIAYLFHPIGDAFTKGGVKRFYYPFSNKTLWVLPKFMRFYTGSFTENIYMIMFYMILVFEIYYLITYIKPPFLNLFSFI